MLERGRPAFTSASAAAQMIIAARAREGWGLPRRPVPEMLMESETKRFGYVKPILETHAMEFLSEPRRGLDYRRDPIARQPGFSPVNALSSSKSENSIRKKQNPQAFGALGVCLL